MRLVPPLFPRRDRLHANVRLAVGLILNILALWFMLGPHHANGTLGEMKAVAVACAVAVAVLLPVFILGGPTQRIMAAVLLASPVFFLAVVVPTRFTQALGQP
jgi:glucan phosphoethanolaminetransferase (alkaline phosphatase superfamily)